MSVSREDSLRQEKGKALLRALHLSELGAAGAARALALHQADEQLDRLARLLPDAIEAGISISEIARATGISRPTLYELRARYGGTVGDLRLAILQAILTGNAVTTGAIAERLGRPLAEVDALVSEYLQAGALYGHMELVGEDEYNEVLSVTPLGLENLEAWIFEDEGAAGNGD
jgi:DNA-binding IclR family transcriptional regulator